MHPLSQVWVRTYNECGSLFVRAKRVPTPMSAECARLSKRGDFARQRARGATPSDNTAHTARQHAQSADRSTEIALRTACSHRIADVNRRPCRGLERRPAAGTKHA